MVIETIEIVGDESIAKLEELRAEYPVSGKYPFLTDVADWQKTLTEIEKYNYEPTAKAIEKSFSIDVLAWFQNRADDFKQYELEDEEFPIDEDGDKTDFIGEWEESAKPSQKEDISVHKDILTRKIKPTVYIGLVEIEKPWMLPAAVKFGGWNDCPYDEVHCAVLRYWLEKYKAEPVSLTRDIIEFWIDSPPQTKEESVELAWQQYYYCTDIVDQGCQELMILASYLKNATSWYFWWD